MASFSQTATDLSPKGYGRLRSITIRLCITDCTGKVYFTDIMVQGGSIATGWVGPSQRNPVDAGRLRRQIWRRNLLDFQKQF